MHKEHLRGVAKNFLAGLVVVIEEELFERLDEAGGFDDDDALGRVDLVQMRVLRHHIGVERVVGQPARAPELRVCVAALVAGVHDHARRAQGLEAVLGRGVRVLLNVLVPGLVAEGHL